MRMPVINSFYRGALAMAFGLCLAHSVQAQGFGGGGGGVGGGAGGGGAGGGFTGGGGMSSSGGTFSGGGSSSPSSLANFQSGFTGFSTYAVGSSGGSSSQNRFGQTTAPRAGAGGTSQGISTTNPFQQYYLNPLRYGYANASSATFGSPLYNSTIFGSTSVSVGGSGGSTSGRTGGSNTRGGTSGRTGSMSGSSATSSFVPSTTPATPRGLPYTTALAADLEPTQTPIPGAAERTELRGKLKDILVSAKDRLPSADNVEIAFENDQLVLKGEVNTERERRLAANMLLLTPGISRVRNDLQVKGAPSPQE